MRSLTTGWIALGLSVALSACASRIASAPASQSARDGKPSQATAASDAEQASRASKARARREASWAEYYSDVMRRIKKHGGIVIWIAPPQVKTVQTAQR